jgi:hypothetical protein
LIIYESIITFIVKNIVGLSRYETTEDQMVPLLKPANLTVGLAIEGFQKMTTNRNFQKMKNQMKIAIYGYFYVPTIRNNDQYWLFIPNGRNKN